MKKKSNDDDLMGYSVNWDKIIEIIKAQKPITEDDVTIKIFEAISGYVLLSKDQDGLEWEDAKNLLITTVSEVFDHMWDAPSLDEFIKMIEKK